MFWDTSNFLLNIAQALGVLLTAAGLPVWLERYRRSGWILVLPLSIAVTVALIAAVPESADVYTWIALILVPIGCALALGWAARFAHPALAPLAIVLLVVAWVDGEGIAGDVAKDLLILGSAITLGRLLAGAAPLTLLKVGLVAMAVIDAILVFGGQLEAPSRVLNAAVPAEGLPQLQTATLDGSSLGYGDFLAATVLGGIIAAEKGPRLLLAVALLIVTYAWDQLFLITSPLPATVPPALVLLGWEWFNRRMRRTGTLVSSTLLILLCLPVALAAAGAGGGSSGFGGGGGGFSGGGFRGSGGSGTGSGSPLVGFVVIGLFVAIVIWLAIAAWQFRRKREARLAAVELASAEAADDDEAFAADRVRTEAGALFTKIQGLWDARDREALDAVVGPDLMVEWRRRLDDFDKKGWHNRVEVIGRPTVDYVSFVNRDADSDDRVVVHITAELKDYVQDRNGNRIMRDNEKDETVTQKEYWTLEKREGRWCLLSIEQDAEGHHNLDTPLVTSSWADDQTLREDAVAERSAADALPAGADVAEFADLDFQGPARTAAQDLALVDGRFDPDLIEAGVRRAIAGWAQAVDGDDAALEAAARPEVVQALLHPGDPSAQTRLVVRGPRIEACTITALDPAAKPPTLNVEIRVRGRRYIENRDTAETLSGDKSSETTFTEKWTLALDGDGEWPWRIANARTPAAA